MNAHWLKACLALAAGEGAGLFLSRGADCWPVTATLALFAALFGHGFAWRGWRAASLFLLGLTLVFHSSLSNEGRLRQSPWLREATPRARFAESAVSPLRRDLIRRAGVGLEHNALAANLNRAILLGERRCLPRRVKRIFIESGTLHVFAISGLHVMLVARLLSWILLLLLVPLRFAGVLAIVPLWGYVLLTGAAPSAVRAGIMASFYFSAPLFRRRPDNLRAWALTFLTVHIADPSLIGNVGSQLSFAIMLSILLAVDLSRSWDAEWKKSACVALAAWCAGVPIAAHAFGRVTPGSLLANIPLIAAAGGTVVSGVIGLAASYVCLPLAVHLNNLSALFTEAMVGVATAVASLPGMNYETTAWPLWTCFLWYVALALAFWLLKRRRPRLP